MLCNFIHIANLGRWWVQKTHCATEKRRAPLLPRSYAQEQKRLAARRSWKRLDIVFLCLYGLNFFIVVLGVLDVGDGYAIDGTAQIKGTY